MSVVQLLRPNASSCDWGGCHQPSVAYRHSPESGGYLPVCEEHRADETQEHVARVMLIKDVLDNHPIVFWTTEEWDRNTASCDGEDCDWAEPIEADYEHPDEAGNLHQAEMIAAALRERGEAS